MHRQRSAAAVRTRLHRELLEMGWCDVEVSSDFEWKAVRRLARAVGRTLGYRVHTRLQPPPDPTPWPRVLTIWDPDMQADPREVLRAALAQGAFEQ